MKWNYQCPFCGVWGNVDWERSDATFTCHSCQRNHAPPGPLEQRSAYVDSHEWPQEIEEAVTLVKGVNCTVPGCSTHYQTLDHRVAWSKGGRTSVDNLFPMCDSHNRSKGDSDYETWLMEHTRHELKVPITLKKALLPPRRT
jgi:hypothetical protein